MQIVITMAGRSSRFLKAGYKEKKYKIEVQGKTIFWWSMRSLKNFFDKEFIFICLKEDNAIEFIYDECKSLGIKKIRVIEIDDVTDGQATTVLKAEKYIDKDFAVYNIDTYVYPNSINPNLIKGDGFIVVFKAEGSSWSFVEFDEKSKIATRVAEKNRISEYGTIGFYYFGSMNIYRMAYDITTKEAGERYIAPMYNSVIRDGYVYVHEIPSTFLVPLGTPEDIEKLKNRYLQ